MATAGSIIWRGLRLISQVESGETPSTQEYADGLEALNAMLSVWRLNKLMCFAQRDETFNTIAAQAAYTVGPSGAALTTNRPVDIDTAYVVVSNTSYDVEMRSDEWYAAQMDKVGQADFPTDANYKPGMPNGTITMYPVPKGIVAFHFLSRTPLTAFAAITDAVTLPDGWEDALAFNLAIRIAPEYEKSVSGEVQATARATLKEIKRSNSVQIEASTELAGLIGGRTSNIITDRA